MIPGENDSEKETQEMTEWIYKNLGPDVPLHFTAFHPDYKMLDKSNTPHATLSKARDIALQNGLHYVYTGNVHDEEASSTYCTSCKTKIIGRDWYNITEWRLGKDGKCLVCGQVCPGVFSVTPGDWGSKRMPVSLTNFEKA